MGIKLRHDVAGIMQTKDDSRFNAGMQMVQRQQERDNAMRSSQMQPLKYNTGGTYGGIGIGDQKKKAKPGIGAEPVFGVDPVLPQQPSMASWQQRNEDIMSNIQAGMYDVATTRALSDIVNRQNKLMTNQRLNDAQKRDAFNQFEMDKDKMEVALGGFSIGPAMRSNQQSATPTFEQYYKPNRKEFRTDYASAKAELVESGNPSPSSDEIIARMRQDYDSWADLGRPMEGRATGGVVRPGEDYLVGERGPEVLRMGENGGYVIPNDQLAQVGQSENQRQGTPINPERQVGEYGGSTTFGVPTILMTGPTQPAQPGSQGRMQQNPYRFIGQGPENPKGVKLTLDSMPPQYVLNDGTHVDSKWENGQWVPDIDQTGPRSRMLGGVNPPRPQASAPAQQPSSTQKRSPRKQPIYFNPGSNSVTNTGRSPIYNDAGNFVGDPSLYDAEGAQNIRQQAGGLSPQPGLRTWTSKDRKYSTEGEMIGFRATQGGDPLTSEMVRIRKKDGVEVDVPLHRLSEEDRQMVMSSPQYDYQIRNQRIGGANQQTFNPDSMEYSPTGSNYQQMFDPNNPEYAAMRAPNQQQEQNRGRFMGEYGMGGVDYGMNPATGNRVTASVRPGGTMLQYDEPVKVHPKATNKSIDEAMTRAGRAKRQRASEEFERQYANSIGKPIDIPNSAVTPPAVPSAPQGSQNSRTNQPAYNPKTDPRIRTEETGGFASNMAETIRNSETNDRVKERMRARADQMNLPKDVRDALDAATGEKPATSKPPAKSSNATQSQQPVPTPSTADSKGNKQFVEDPAWTEWWKNQKKGFELDPKESELRTFTSADGKSKFNGRVLRVSDQSSVGPIYVTVMKEDGTVYNTTFDKFSRADKEYMNEIFLRGDRFTDEDIKKRARPESAKQKMNNIMKNPKYTNA